MNNELESSVFLLVRLVFRYEISLTTDEHQMKISMLPETNKGILTSL